MKLLLKDEDFPLHAFKILAELGHDILTLNDLKLNNISFPDSDVLSKAKTLERAIVTHNRRDFIKLHRDRKSPHFGIIVCTRFSNDHDLAHAIHNAINAVDISDQLVRITKTN